ncbi:MAG: ABC transporter ATP-binding protein [Candidatus Omnitrophica bacterium]|nr:ABC transporter ATP-binding protein [Candidatus Omnitrophota bacterium]
MVNDVAISAKNISKSFTICASPLFRLLKVAAPGVFAHRDRFRCPTQEFWALREISFELRRGSVLGVIGRNGSGKSTLLQIICGIMKPTGGNVTARGRIGAVLELGSGFNDQFTGRENIFFNAAILGISRNEVKRNLDAIIEFADIGDFIDRPVRMYSRGMVMRLAFSISVNVQPDILLIDEALAVGDAAFQFKCIDRLSELRASGVTVVLISHEMGMVRSFCDKALYLSQGRVRQFGATDEVVESYFMDICQEKIRTLGFQKEVKRKKNIGGVKNSAFGTHEGQIVRVSFADGLPQGTFRVGEKVTVEVTVALKDSVKRPRLSFYVQNRQLFHVGGVQVYGAARDSQSSYHLVFVFSFFAHLAPGAYFITLVLQNQLSDSDIIVIEKQVAALSFDIMSIGQTPFLGTVDLKVLACQKE